MGLAVACTSGTDGGTAGNTELNLDIIDNGSPYDRVDYRITCDGNPGAAIPDADTSGTDYAYDDSVDISGAFEVVDTRVPPVWQVVLDLPPTDCTVTLSVYYEDEIVCVGWQTITIPEGGTAKFDIVLVCSLSVDLPDGMADIDGTFEFITGNVCPKLYVLNSIPSVATDPGTGVAATEIQYRAKDPDNTCGNNCDPQTCDFSNPPVCTPYPSNINDPVCNPALGGDPNDTDCQDGLHAGLVCTIVGIPSASGVPGGTFISPLDGTTPVGPVLPVNLNTISGIPGFILPGLGGPAGTNAANSPAYPPAPNLNGSLPPLVYQCDLSLPGEVFVQLACSDGDAECDQGTQIIVTCPGENFCNTFPIDCDDGNECTLPQICDAFCDPATSCDRCTPEPPLPQVEGSPCDNGGNTQVCDGAGTCVECVADSDCTTLPSPPVDCQLPNTCVANSCVAGGTAPDGTVCSNGLCDGSGIGSTDPPCVFVACDPCDANCGQTPLSCMNALALGCTNNVTADISILPFVLNVDPEPILAGQLTAALFGGVANFSETFLDAAQGAVPGGVTQADLINLGATVQIRNGGALASDVTLTNPLLPTTCLIGGTACDPANNVLPSVPGILANTDCIPQGTFNPCQALVTIPTSSDCSVDGVCDQLGKKASQCDLNGFCVTGDLPLPLADQAANFTPSPLGGQVNFGFADQDTGNRVCVGGDDDGSACYFDADCETNPDNTGTCPATDVPINADGTYALPAAVFTAPPALNEIKVNAAGLSVALVCTMAVDAGGPLGPTPPVPDQASPTPTSVLSIFNVQVP